MSSSDSSFSSSASSAAGASEEPAAAAGAAAAAGPEAPMLKRISLRSFPARALAKTSAQTWVSSVQMCLCRRHKRRCHRRKNGRFGAY